MVSNLQVKGYLLVEEIKKRDVTFFIISFTSAMSCHGMLPDTSIIKAISTTIGHSKRWITDEMISTEFAQVLQSWTKFFGTIMQYSYFSVILGSLIKQFILFEIFLQFPLPPPYTGTKNSGIGPVWIGKRPEMQKRPKTFVHDCRLIYWTPKFCHITLVASASARWIWNSSYYL